MKNKVLYYILSLTWGLPVTLLGTIIAAALIITGHKPRRWGGCLYFNVGDRWGGCEFGLFFLTDKLDNEHVKNHEFGHSIQNCYLGVFMPFIVSIPSAVRYWYREIRERRGLVNKMSYDSMWFEGWATSLGNENIKYWRNT